MTEIVHTSASSQIQLLDPQAQRIVDFLQNIGLPHENIIAAQDQRQIISQNLPQLVESLPTDVKQGARYLSKFVVGAGIGLFDYALNSVWNEVVLDLRKKAIAYSLDIFYDAAVGGTKRGFYESENDLPALSDSVLLDTCRKLELISDTTHKKLKHILDMRNDIGISHPTNYSINAFELLGWLQTCIQDVLNDRPTEAALQVQAFIGNLKTYTQPLDPSNLATIGEKMGELPTRHCGQILRTMFGIFVSVDTDQQVRRNIADLACGAWNASSDDDRYKLGLILEGYNTNLYHEKYEYGQQFFTAVGGNAYRSNSERAIIVDGLIDELLEKHNGWDNFHHEAPVADRISSYINTPQDILPNFASKLVQVILQCRIGRGVRYCNGVSTRGKPYYDRILGLLGDGFVPHVFQALMQYQLQSRLDNPICRGEAVHALEVVKSGVVNQRMQECLSFLIEHLPTTGRIIFDVRFTRMAADYLSAAFG